MISSASASEINETQTLSLASDNGVSVAEDSNVLSVENANESSADKNSGNLLGESNGNRDLLGADAGTFAELQTIIDNAKSWDTITLDRDYELGTNPANTWVNGLVISKPLTINGNGHTLDAQEKSRIMYVGSVGVTLNNITFANAYMTSSADAAGSIFISLNSGNVNISYCTFNNSKCKARPNGGGAIGIECDDVNIDHCNFYNCNSILIDNHGGSGGAINWHGSYVQSGKYYDLHLNSGSVTNCYFENCLAQNNGGAIESYCNNLKLINNTFNTISTTGCGGAIVLYKYSANTLINNNTFSNCHANIHGGVISSENTDCKNVTIINSKFYNCDSVNGGVLYLNSQESYVINCTFNNNYASDLGGVFYSAYQNNNFINCSGRNNTAKQGAVIYINAANNLVDACNFRDNYASSYDIIYLSGNNNKLLNSVFVNNTSTETILSTSGTGVVINNSIIIENKGTNIIHSATSNGCTADYNWFGNSEDNYNTRPQCNNYNNVKVTKWYYLNLMAEQSIVAENQDVTMNMGLHGLYDSNTGKKTESLDYDSIPFWLVPDEFLPGEFTLTTDNGQTSVPSKVFTNKDCTFTYTPENMDSGTVTGTNSFGQTIFETITVIKAGSFTDLYNRINYTEENATLDLPYDFTYNETYDPAHLDSLYGLDDVSEGLPIDKNISINGNYNIINGLNQVDIFNITSNVELENVNLRNGQINNNGNLTLKNVNHRGSEYSIVNNGNLYLEKEYDLMTIKNNGMIYGPFTITVMENKTIILQIDNRIANINATTDFGVTIEGGKLSFINIPKFEILIFLEYEFSDVDMKTI